jgi:hypothetical protein
MTNQIKLHLKSIPNLFQIRFEAGLKSFWILAKFFLSSA